MNDGKALVGEYVTTQHEPVVFGIRMKKWKDKRTMGPNNIKCWKCEDEDAEMDVRSDKEG